MLGLADSIDTDLCHSLQDFPELVQLEYDTAETETVPLDIELCWHARKHFEHNAQCTGDEQVVSCFYSNQSTAILLGEGFSQK